jgi:transposase
VNTIVVERRRRRRYSAEFKAEAVTACLQPGVSMAAVAMSRSLNANLLRRWVVEAERAAEAPQGNPLPKALPPPPDTQRFIPVAIERSAHTDPRIRVEIRRGATVVSVEWPPSAARECAEWLRGFLK